MGVFYKNDGNTSNYLKKSTMSSLDSIDYTDVLESVFDGNVHRNIDSKENLVRTTQQFLTLFQKDFEDKKPKIIKIK